MVGTEALAGIRMRARDQFGEARQAAFVDPQLPRIGPALADHGGSFHPEQSRAAGGEAVITPEGQLVGLPVRRSVAAFHGENHQPVGE